MARSTQFIRFVSPVDYFNHQVELESANTLNVRPGRLLVLNASGLAVLCDANNPVHRVAPVFVCNLDVSERDDADDAVVLESGNTLDKITCVASCNADVYINVAELVANTGVNGQPAVGDYVCKSLTTPGLYETLTAAQIQALITATTISAQEADGFKIGRVIEPPSPQGFFRARLYI
jgi:hypothetical protein